MWTGEVDRHRHGLHFAGAAFSLGRPSSFPIRRLRTALSESTHRSNEAQCIGSGVDGSPVSAARCVQQFRDLSLSSTPRLCPQRQAKTYDNGLCGRSSGIALGRRTDTPKMRQRREASRVSVSCLRAASGSNGDRRDWSASASLRYRYSGRPPILDVVRSCNDLGSLECERCAITTVAGRGPNSRDRQRRLRLPPRQCSQQLTARERRPGVRTSALCTVVRPSRQAAPSERPS